MSIFIDGTMAGSSYIRKMLQLHQVPYYNFDFSIQSFVKMMESYIIARMATDSVFILQDETSNLCYVYILTMRKKWAFIFFIFSSFFLLLPSFLPFIHSWLLIFQTALILSMVCVALSVADEALYFFIVKSKLRVILLNGLTAESIESLKMLRPLPDYYSIISDTPNMDKIFKKVKKMLILIAFF